jgi:glycosyltransferase involved in cell wall biosynthesis
MKLLYDLNSLRPPRSGIGYYTQHLIEGLLQQPDVEDIAGWVGSTVFQGASLDALMRTDAALGKAAQFSDGVTASMLRAARHVPGVYRSRTIVRNIMSASARKDFSGRGYLYHETNFVASPYKGPSVVTIHDLSHRRHPEFHPRVAVNYLDDGLPPTFRQVSRVIADSHYTKREIHDIYGLPDEKVVTIHLGVEPSFRPYSQEACAPALAELGLRHRGFVLSVCTLQPRKNLRRLVEGFARLSADLRQAFPLVLIGADGWMNSALMRDIEPLANAGQVITPGYVSRATLLKLYASAAVFGYPSLYEGFGLPIAEALASGVPVLTSNVTSIPEVVDDAALVVDPYSVEEIAAGLERMLSDEPLRNDLIAKGLRRAAELTWESTVQKTADVYRSVVG